MKKKIENQLYSYSFNQASVPYPEQGQEKIKPETAVGDFIDSSSLFKKAEELPLEEQARQYMDTYKKAERAVINNFYIGGAAHRKGILDSIYKGFNPLNP